MDVLMNESDFNKAICKKLLPDLRPTDRVWKVRDDQQGGIPDNFFMISNKVMWAEFKYHKVLPKRDTTTVRIDLSELQKGWLHDLDANKQHTCVIVGAGQGRTATAVFLTLQEALKGITVAEYNMRAVCGYQHIANTLKDRING